MSRVPAADNCLRVLDCLASARGPLAAATIASTLSLPRSSVYQLLSVLVGRGYVSHVPEEKRYGLGPLAYSLGSSYTRQQPLTRLGAPLIAKLVDRVGESAHLAVLHGREVLYLVEERARNRPSLITDVGVRLPAAETASGRAMLACVPAAQLRAIFPEASQYSRVKRIVEQVRERGFASEDGDVTPGLVSVAVAVLDHVGWPAAAIALTLPRPDDWSASQPRSGTTDLVESVGVVAKELGRRIHGRPVEASRTHLEIERL